MHKKTLWLALKDYHFEHIVPPSLMGVIAGMFGGGKPGTKAFADKIARKHMWERSFALTAISEYKKFVYLAVISNFQVTPSKIIDAVWHEHILFSKGYQEFCTNVICYQLHHNPELMPLKDQTERYREQYQRTISLYKFEFGKMPPAEIWSDTKYDKKKNSKNSTSSDGYRWESFDYDPYLSSGVDNEAGLHTHFEGESGNFGGGGASGNWDDADLGSDSDNSGSGDSSSCSDSSGCSGGCSGGSGGD